jgi:hypothetical protein
MNFFNGDDYEGYFMKGIKEGTGTYSDSDGNYYTGNFKNDDKHGLGTLKYYNGDTYIGDWNDGEKSGKGTISETSLSLSLSKQNILVLYYDFTLKKKLVRSNIKEHISARRDGSTKESG